MNKGKAKITLKKKVASMISGTRIYKRVHCKTNKKFKEWVLLDVEAVPAEYWKMYPTAFALGHRGDLEGNWPTTMDVSSRIFPSAPGGGLRSGMTGYVAAIPAEFAEPEFNELGEVGP